MKTIIAIGIATSALLISSGSSRADMTKLIIVGCNAMPAGGESKVYSIENIGADGKVIRLNENVKPDARCTHAINSLLSDSTGCPLGMVWKLAHQPYNTTISSAGYSLREFVFECEYSGG
jgi:hypothetical protein